MARKLTDHKVNPANDKLTITAIDDPGPGGAHHIYVIEGFSVEVVVTELNPEDLALGIEIESTEENSHIETIESAELIFQKGPIAEVGVNGITQDALIAILLDRLRCFQAGPYACRENALALTNLEQAQHWLHSRTLKRMQRGVEGTHEL